MNDLSKEFVDYITKDAPKNVKSVVEKAALEKFNLVKDRKVYHNNSFAVRFSYSKSASNSFSNTVLSLSALEKYDKIPFFVVLVRQSAENIVLLSNTTFLRKISHSSQELSMTNIKGSFNGSDIIRKYGQLDNVPCNFESLFSIHQGMEWEDNLSRLVEATSSIVPTSQKFVPSKVAMKNIEDSIQRATTFIKSDNFNKLQKDLNNRCNLCKNEILVASHIENTNIRGRLIESLITSDEEQRKHLIKSISELEKELPSYDTKNGLGDYYVHFDNGETYTDIKTKILYLNSNPKAYNIDKFLKIMSEPNSIFLFFFIGIDKDSIFKTLLCSVFHNKLIDNTILQFHWAGRSTRGVAQFSGTAIDSLLQEKLFVNNIDYEKSKVFLKTLIDR